METLQNLKPERSVAVGGLAIGIPAGILLAWVVGLFGIEVPAEVAVAMGGLISAIATHFVPNGD